MQPKQILRVTKPTSSVMKRTSIPTRPTSFATKTISVATQPMSIVIKLTPSATQATSIATKPVSIVTKPSSIATKRTSTATTFAFITITPALTPMPSGSSRKSCASYYKLNQREDGVYSINPDGLGNFDVWCDMTTDGGGWTVFQRRQNASVNFYRGWHEYKNGFGNLDGNFWLGLEKIHRLSNSGQNALRVDMVEWESDTKLFAKYESFSLESESKDYEIDVDGFSGNYCLISICGG